MPLPPLPERPDFPVYGLEEPELFPTWLEIWNGLFSPDLSRPGNRLSQVQVAHGDLSGRSQGAVVTSVPRLERVRLSPEMSVGPTGIGDAAMSALLGVLHVKAPRRGRSDWFRQGVKWASDLAQHPDTDPWADISVVADDRTFSLRYVTRDDAWAVVGDLTDVAVGIWGYGVRVHGLRLTSVDATALAVGGAAY